MDVERWLVRYGRAWEGADAEALVELFDEAATYRSHIFRDQHDGIDAIRAYWRRATATQSDTEVRFGRPVVDGRRVAVEWWTTMVDDGEAITLPGCLVLHFGDDGRCVALREYWHVAPGRLAAPPGWGE